MMSKERYTSWKSLKVPYHPTRSRISSDEFTSVRCFISNKTNLTAFLSKFEFSFAEALLERYKKKDTRKELKFVQTIIVIFQVVDRACRKRLADNKSKARSTETSD